MQFVPKKTKIIESEFLLAAYCNGFFPMADPHTGQINWFSPERRGILELNDFHIPRSLKTILKRGKFEIKINNDFESVIKNCANRKETWISDVIIRSYLELHRIGYAHSMEVWIDDKLAGGLYGVAIKAAFFGESMFTKVKNSSKIALVFLVERLKARGYYLLDTQFMTPHLQMFGGKEITKEEYLKRLKIALSINCSFM